MRIKLIATFLLSSVILSAQLKSPADFLGYELGTKFTPHYQIVNYFNQAAATMPRMMKLEQYGATNEGRPLLMAIVTAPENFSRLDEIRKNNLRLTGLLTDKAGDVNAPAIVWLSYNVHGNEPSSSEVSMKTLYELLHPENSEVNTWLKNTVVIIDPCLNPDGRDRYVNWFTQMVGKNPNADPDSREHSEPWPGGRVNHYNFDLNRDWAWQTQIETQQRVKKYNEWMPEVHCDFHEQFPNNPYYFAPAAEPMHEVITPWQRDFQVTIGRNHAKYFDANGWLYFTKEIFDLFYPSYGDTYPLYNGSIGMTYEQAGHSPGGLAIVKADGDTLTLKDRIAHHFTTSMSTIEIVSKNAERVVKEFKKFYDDAKANLNAEYKTYVIEADGNKKAVLEKLFTSNNISFVESSVAPFKFNGFNYANGKTENITITDKTVMVLQSNQPKSTLLKVLMEPKSKLSDSVTYDITGWAIPYAYGVQAYALKEKLNVQEDEPRLQLKQTATSTYGYIAEAGNSNGKFLAQLLKANIKVRYNEKSFTTDKHKFSPGSLIILAADNKERMQQIFTIAYDNKTYLYPVPTGFVDKGLDFGSESVHLIKKPKVAMLTGSGVYASGAGEIWHFFEHQLDYPISLINADEIGNVNWKNIDVLIMPGGNYKFLSDKEAAADLKTWVRQGGKLIALDDAVAQLANGDWGLKLKKADDDKDKKDDSNYNQLRKYENRERDGIVNNIPGAIYKVELDNSHPLAFGYPDYYFTLKQNDNIYEFMKDGWNVGVVKKNNQVAGFVGSKVKEKIKDGAVIGVVPMGSGSVTFFADDPIFRSFWESGKLLLSNAVFFVGQ